MTLFRSHALAGAILALLAAAVFLGIDLNRSGREEVLRQFDAFQVLLARQLAHQAAAYLEERSEHLQILARLASIQTGDAAKIPADLALYDPAPKNAQNTTITVLDTAGTVVFSTRESAAGLNCANRDFFQWATSKKNRGAVFVSSWTRAANQSKVTPSGSSFLLATPLYQSSWSSTSRRSVQTWSGVLVMTVDLETVLTKHLATLAPKDSHARVWVMDQDGTVLLQPEHPEMVQKNVVRAGPQCAQCHVSLNFARKMLDTQVGAIEYKLKDHVRKRAAFVPMRFANASWVMVVNAPYDKVTAFVGQSYRKTLLLLGAVAAALSLASVLVYRINLSRVRAQAEAREWQQKHQLEEQVRRAEERYRTLFEQSPDGIVMMDPDTLQPIEFSDAAHRQLGYSREEFAALRWSDVEANGTPERTKRWVEQLLQRGEARFETEHRTKQGELRQVEVIAQTLKLGDRTILHCIHHDITERKRAEAALAHHSKQLETLHQLSLGIAAETETGALLTTITTQTLKLFRGTDGGLWLYRHGRDVLDWVVDSAGAVATDGVSLRKGEDLAGKVWEAGVPLVVADYQHWEGRITQIEKRPCAATMAAPLAWGDTFVGVLQVGSDTPACFTGEDAALLGLIATQAAIAIRNAALLEQVRADDATKTTLLHDVNHRVKNNLSRLLEIIRLERERALPAATEWHGALNDLEHRLRGMEVVHGMLSTAQWQPLPLHELVTRIVTAALSGSPIRDRIRVSVVAPSEPLAVVPEQATALALILSELASNSVKHAFGQRAEGHLEVRLRVEDRAKGRPLIRLQYRDDGPGWPEAVLHGQKRHVGLHLIQTSVRSPLRGELVLRNDEGAVAELVFKLALVE